MSTQVVWNGHHIQLYSMPSPKYLWFATETAILIDGVKVAHSGGFKFNEKASGSFLHKGRSHEVSLEMKSDLVTLISIPYKLQIDGETIAQGRLDIDNWLASLGMSAITCLSVACLVFLVFLVLSGLIAK